MNTLLPTFVKLTDKPCLVVGAGKIALQKVQQLLDARANITVIATHHIDEFLVFQNEQKISLLSRAYEFGDSKDFFLVISATNDHELNKSIYEEVNSNQLLINVVDCPALCNFYFGSVYQNGDIKIAVSTNGQCPSLAKYIRDSLAKTYSFLENILPNLVLKRKKVHTDYEGYDERKGLMQEAVHDALDEALLQKHHFLKGSVILVGAGPGHEDLITVRGQTAISLAVVILYDALVNPILLQHAKPQAVIVYAGKRPDKCNPYKQTEINQLLIDYAKQGNLVVRLKGGDPFIFGRGSEELQALAHENIPYQVVPGVSAALGAAAFSGIPLTHRDYNSSFAVITGHLACEKPVDWTALWQAHKMLVVYMGVKALPKIVSQLINAACPFTTPVAIIENASMPQQRVLISALKDVVSQAQEQHFTSPSIILIGQNVSLHATLYPHYYFK